MTASELRIGNWIQSKGLTNKFHEWQVTAEDIPQIESNQEHIQEYKGIPLTEEWLLKFGFKYYGTTWLRDGFKGAIILYLNNTFEYMYGEFEIDNDYKYVHQLQNLYFALTGTELTIRDEGKERNA